MLDFLIPILAKFWDKFKVSDPRTATFIALALGTLLYFADQGTLLGAFDLPEWASSAIKYISVIWIGLNGSRTARFLEPGPPPAN